REQRTLQACALLHRAGVDRSGATSILPRQCLFELSEEVRPPRLGPLIELLLIGPEALLLHAQIGSLAGRGERPGDHALESVRSPAVGQRLERLDLSRWHPGLLRRSAIPRRWRLRRLRALGS